MSEDKICIKCECNECKAKFDVWLDNINRDPEHEPDPETITKIKNNIMSHCPVCQSQNQ